MRFRIPITLGVLVFSLLIFYAFWPLFKSKSPKHRIDEASYEKISLGMSEDEVIAIMGVAYGQHYSGTFHVIVPFGPINSTGSIVSDKLGEDILCETVTSNGEFLYPRKGWVGEDLSIWVLFDQHRKVINKFSYPVSSIKP
jgi:hypothetical protein